eukprot:TRINITY_DN78118_c0_g1_i1.p1 TRINITY_DN78118_c0_g1~~TRINITY_DN78118_c0_g1_i1.p1  ORF type:complete len:445 (+),score=95.11 TRINITY_DN78118_c0_g1_i1:429-1763(+)
MAEYEKILAVLKKRDPHQPEFFQAAEEVFRTLEPVFKKDPKYLDVAIRLLEPVRMIVFRVPWKDAKGVEHVNRGYRVEFSNALGPFKGGLRFHPSVNLSVIKFLGFEQIFKNSLTTLPMGAGKGGCDFDPKGKSDVEVESFCKAFMTELYRHIGPDTDVPAGDIGVGGREIGYLFGQYKKITNTVVGVLTGKGISYGGSYIRPEATGYGTVYFLEEMVKTKGESMKGLRVTVSGSGNVSQYCIEKLLDLEAIPITASDSGGYILEPEGFTREQLAYIMELKNVKRGRISEYLNFSKTAKYFEGQRPWGEKCDVACPCATQNEIEIEDAKKLVAGGCRYVSEGANMPSTTEAIDLMVKNGVYFGPAKAANAGGVAVSGLEMSQNSLRLQWTREEVDAKLKGIMQEIYKQCIEAARMYNLGDDLQAGANIAGFLKVADSMIAEGSC